MGFFKKKECAVCGEKKGLLGAKLADGNYLCGKCAKKHSFTRSFKMSDMLSDQVIYQERGLYELSLEDYKALVAAREENLEELQAFNRTAHYCNVVHIDEDARELVFIDSMTFGNKERLYKENPPVFKTENLAFARITFSKMEETEKLSGEIKKIEQEIYLVLGFDDPLYDIIRIRIGKITTKNGFFAIRSSITPEVEDLIDKLGSIISWEVSWSEENDVLTPANDMDAYWRYAKKARDYGYLSGDDIRSCLHSYYGRDRKLMREVKKMYNL